MKKSLKVLLAAGALTLTAQAMAQISFYENEGWRGRVFSTTKPVRNFSNIGFNDRASSVVVARGNWEVCDDANFGGNCTVLRKGSYESLSGMGLNDRISSVRPAPQRSNYSNAAPAPLSAPTYEYRQRPDETIYQAPVTAVRAIVGAPEQRCWIEREQATQPSQNNVGGAIAGALIGGVLGHQIGGGTGRDLATAGGAVAGAAIGNNPSGAMGVLNGNNNNNNYGRDVRRCENVPSNTPEYWDVTYNYRGVEHHVQMSTAPGATVPVNRNGEPRR